MDDPLEGNSFLTQNPIKLTKSIKPISVHPNDEINFRFKTKVAPKTVVIYSWISTDKKEIYNQYTSTISDKILIPKRKGEYIFEVAGGWEDSHWTSDIFKLVVE